MRLPLGKARSQARITHIKIRFARAGRARDRGIVVVVHEGSSVQNTDYILEAFDNKAYGAKLKEVLTTYPDLKGIIGGPMPTSAGAGRLIAERNLNGKLFFSGTGLVSVAGEYLKNDNLQYIQFWDPAAAGYAMNEIAVLALEGKKAEIKAGLNLCLPGYTSLLTPDATHPNALYGAGWVGVTKANMGEYKF